MLVPIRDTMDSVKQSAALCLLRLNRSSPDLVPMGEWTARVVHLLNDQHLVRQYPIFYYSLHLNAGLDLVVTFGYVVESSYCTVC